MDSQAVISRISKSEVLPNIAKKLLKLNAMFVVTGIATAGAAISDVVSSRSIPIRVYKAASIP